MDDLHATHSELIRRQRRKLSLRPLICFVMLFQRSSVYGFLIGCNHEVGWGIPNNTVSARLFNCGRHKEYLSP
jgi:hypothetical protein